ncbi:hypothetical protein JN535_04030 [Cellulosimicrobium cellulans]|uniref:hypothetical protein n=1 Tax=Cellulosimicrobium cellulans TaxID=1710 RepID=UPI001962A65B|nr:hypothetical protein [Cellulosimicrobium cellulans]MBN0039342.1 hypothetical protein [Cellulosimicrobium cellulans]
MAGLVEFLQEQFASEEWLAQDERGRITPPPRPRGGFYPAPLPSPFQYVFNPARAEADCTMRRTLLRLVESDDLSRATVLRALGEVYRSHPDFDPTWLRAAEPD